MIGILGAGFGGIALAVFLRKSGMDVKLFEASGEPSAQGGTVTMFPNAMRVLRSLGVADKVEQVGIEVRNQQFLARNGKLIVNRGMSGRGLYGEPSIVIPRRVLLQILIQKAGEVGVNIEYGREVVSLSQGEECVELEFLNGEKTSLSVLVGCDGLHSVVRKFILGGDTKSVEYSGGIYFGGYCDFDEKKLNVADGEQKILVGSDSYFSYMYDRDKRLDGYSLFWFSQYRREESLSRSQMDDLGDGGLLAEAMSCHSGWDGPVEEMMKKSERYCKANIFQVRCLPKWSSGRVVILGDSAHAMNAISGQGAATAMEDAEVLAKLFGLEFSSHQKRFQIFEDLRRERVESIAGKAARSNDLLLSGATGIAEWFRNIGYGAMIRLIPEKIANRDFFYSVEQQFKEEGLLNS